MKREFKKGDRVLVRNNDLQEWQLRTLDRAGGDRWYPFVDTDDTAWSQCRHIDDFRTGDKVQIKSEGESEEWQDAVYACALPRGNHWPHEVYNNAQTDTFVKKFVRWHPSMPWAEKEEPLTLEQRVEALERKMNER